MIEADGSELQRLIDEPIDDPRAAWSPDGSSLAYSLGSAGIMVRDLASATERLLTSQENYGGIAWAR